MACSTVISTPNRYRLVFSRKPGVVNVLVLCIQVWGTTKPLSQGEKRWSFSRDDGQLQIPGIRVLMNKSFFKDWTLNRPDIWILSTMFDWVSRQKSKLVNDWRTLHCNFKYFVGICQKCIVKFENICFWYFLKDNMFVLILLWILKNRKSQG